MKYTVTKETELIETVTYTVEAKSLEDAIKKVEDGDVHDNDDYETYDTGEISYSVEEKEE